jgi:hypothetical protein
MRLGLPASAPSDSVKSISLWELTNPSPPQQPEHWPEKTYFWPKKPSLAARSIKLAKAGLTALGVVSIGAVAGIGNYYLNDVSGASLFGSHDALSLASESPPPPIREEGPPGDLVETVADELPRPAPSTAAPPNERLAALLDQPETPASVVPPAILKQVSMFRAPKREEAAMPAAEEVQLPQADDARLPRARPDEPIITGSIGRSSFEPQTVADRKTAKPSRWHRFGPCAALRSLRVPYLFGNRCGRYTHYDPPPPRQGVRIVAAPASAPARQYSPQPYQPPHTVQD